MSRRTVKLGNNGDLYNHRDLQSIKETSKSERLSPISTSTKSGGNKNLTPLQNDYIDNSTLEALRRRVNELSMDNSKLIKQLEQADISIQNYRGFLSHQSAKARRTDCASQTDHSSSQQLEMALRKAEYRIKILEEEKSVMKRDRDETRLSIEKRGSRTITSSSSSQLSLTAGSEKIANLVETVSRLQSIIDQKEDKSSSVSEGKPSTARSNKAIRKQAIKDIFSKRKKLLKADKSNMKSTMSMFSTFMQQSLTSLMEMIRANHMENRRMKLQWSRVVDSEQRLQARLLESDMKCADLVDALRSVEGGRGGASARMSFASNADGISSLFPRNRMASLLSSALLTDPNPTATSSSITNDNTGADGSAPGDSRENLMAYLQMRLDTALKRFEDLESKHLALVKAVKHEAHVRDLQRVSALREASLNAEQSMAEMKHAKEVRKVLMFCLETAEKSLSDSLPHVVTKLVEGREKRMAALERTVMEKLRDIEQRSSETCATSSSHLESFLLKAEKKRKETEKDYSLSLKQVQETLLKIRMGTRYTCYALQTVVVV
eukprot:gene4955-9911_t